MVDLEKRTAKRNENEMDSWTAKVDAFIEELRNSKKETRAVKMPKPHAEKNSDVKEICKSLDRIGKHLQYLTVALAVGSCAITISIIVCTIIIALK